MGRARGSHYRRRVGGVRRRCRGRRGQFHPQEIVHRFRDARADRPGRRRQLQPLICQLFCRHRFRRRPRQYRGVRRIQQARSLRSRQPRHRPRVPGECAQPRVRPHPSAERAQPAERAQRPRWQPFDLLRRHLQSGHVRFPQPGKLRQPLSVQRRWQLPSQPVQRHGGEQHLVRGLRFRRPQRGGRPAARLRSQKRQHHDQLRDQRKPSRVLRRQVQRNRFGILRPARIRQLAARASSEPLCQPPNSAPSWIRAAPRRS